MHFSASHKGYIHRSAPYPGRYGGLSAIAACNPILIYYDYWKGTRERKVDGETLPNAV